MAIRLINQQKKAYFIEWDCNSGNASGDDELNTENDQFLSNHVKCILSRGIITNRFQLIKANSLPDDISNSHLIEYLYQSFGVQAATKIEGNFSWLLWNAKKNEMIAVCDRMGQNNLYYRVKDLCIFFSNKLEDLLPLGKISSTDINLKSISALLHQQGPLAGQTFYQNIHAVPPGHIYIFKRAIIEKHIYWQIKPLPTLQLPSDQDYADLLRELIFKIVGEYIQSNRIGVTLSGGLDSTTVAAAIRANLPSQTLHAISWTAPELPSADETLRIQSVSKLLDLNSHVVRGDLLWTLSSIENKTPRSVPFLHYYGEIWDAMFRESQLHGVTYLFTGVGGDELFGGYIHTYPDLFLSGKWGKLYRKIQKTSSARKKSIAEVVKQTLLAPAIQYIRTYNSKGLPDPSPWLGQSLLAAYKEYKSELALISGWVIPGKMERYLQINVPWTSLIMEHFSLMAESQEIELVYPLLDHRLVDFSMSLPSEQSNQYGFNKAIIRFAMQGLLPTEILMKKDITPATAVFNRGVIERQQEKVWSLIKGMRAAELGFINEQRLQADFQNYVNSGRSSTFFWAAITLEDWLRRYAL